MAENDIIQQLSSEFGQDPLFKFIRKMRIEDELFDEHILNLNFGAEYSTTDIEKWYCNDELKAPTMRHWQKSLNEYLETTLIGQRGSVRMNYRAVFRLRMALLLREHKVNLQRVCQLVGLTHTDPEVVYKKNFDQDNLPATNPKEIEIMRHLIGQMISIGLIEEQDNMPVLRINEFIKKAVEEQTPKLPDPETERTNIENKIKQEIEDQYKFIGNQLKTDLQKDIDHLKRRLDIQDKLEEEALVMWEQKPESERFIKLGLFRKTEDIQKRDRFIRNYVRINIDARLKEE